MSPLVIALVLGAAVIHASWNALLKDGDDRFLSMTAMSVVMGIISLAALPFLPMPARDAWPFIMASAVVHLIYQLLLVRMYRSGDFSQTYPIARGSSPLLIALGALLFAGEPLGSGKVIGIVLVSGGIIALAVQGRRFHVDSAPTAFMTGAAIAVYSVIDGVGARLSGDAIAYIAWMSVIWAGLTVVVYVAVRGFSLGASRRDIIASMGGGAIALLGYTAVVWAMRTSPMGPVSALRETSVVFAALIAWLCLGERLTAYRIAACGVIVAGATCLGIAP